MLDTCTEPVRGWVELFLKLQNVETRVNTRGNQPVTVTNKDKCSSLKHLDHCAYSYGNPTLHQIIPLALRLGM